MSERDRDRIKSGKHHQQQCAYDIFDRNSPRPPVPGEERVQWHSDWPPMESDLKYHRSASPCNKRHYPVGEMLPPMNYESEPPCKPHSRPSSRHDRPLSAAENPRTPNSENASPPACLRWAQSLNMLLDDPDGVELFRKYLQSEGKPYADLLDFWFACEGLRKQTEPELIQQLVKVIYK